MWTAGARQRYAWTRRKEGLRITDLEWALLEPVLPQQTSMGRPWKHRLRVTELGYRRTIAVEEDVQRRT